MNHLHMPESSTLFSLSCPPPYIPNQMLSILPVQIDAFLSIILFQTLITQDSLTVNGLV